MNSQQVDKLKHRWGSGGLIAGGLATPDATRRPQDFYPTPPRLAHKAVDLIPQRIQPRRVLDPGAGTGIWGEAARCRWPNAEIDGIDIRETRNKAYTHWWTDDYLSAPLQGGYDVIIGAPPYSMAEKFIRHSIKLLKPEGQLVFLLRLSFLEGRTRARGLYELYPPYKVYVLAERPSFLPPRTEPTAYLIAHWSHPGFPHETVLDWLSWK